MITQSWLEFCYFIELKNRYFILFYLDVVFRQKWMECLPQILLFEMIVYDQIIISIKVLFVNICIYLNQLVICSHYIK